MIWHYTVGRYLPGILADGAIKPATHGLAEGERPVVWFSTNPWWEPTADKNWINRDGSVIFLNKKQTEERCGGLVRIQVQPEAAPHTWQDFCRMAKTPRRVIRGLEISAKEKGSNPATWRVSFGPVTSDQWIEAEVWQDNEWVPMLHAAGCDRCDKAGLVKSLSVNEALKGDGLTESERRYSQALSDFTNGECVGVVKFDEE